MDRRVTCKTETIRYLFENSGELVRVDLCSDLLDTTPKPQAAKNKRAPLHQTEKLLHRKRNDPQSEKVTYTRGEDSSKRLASQGDRLGERSTSVGAVGKRNNPQSEKVTYTRGEDSSKCLASQGDRLGERSTSVGAVVGLTPWHSGWYWRWRRELPVSKRLTVTSGVMTRSCGTILSRGSQMMLVVKNLPADAGGIRDRGLIHGSGRSPGGGNGNPLPVLAWRIPWAEEPGGLPSRGSETAGHN